MQLKLVCMVVLLTGMSFFSFAQITLTIEEAMDIAEDNNPQMRTAKLNYMRTQYRLEVSRAGLKPQFSMTVDPFSYSQNRQFDNRTTEWYTSKNLSTGGRFRSELPFLLTDGVLSLTNTFGWQNSESTRGDNPTTYSKTFSNVLALRYDQPLFTYNRRQMEMKKLVFDHENSGISYALQRLRTEQNITRQFYTVYSTQNDLVISHAELDNAQKNYDIIKEKVIAELSAREELFQAEVNLTNAESAVQRSEVLLKNAKDDLKVTLGMPLKEDINVSVEIVAIPMLIDEERAIQSGLLSRMELRQREISMAEADLEMITTKAMNEFKGDITLSMGISGDNERFGDIYSLPTNSPRVGISFTIPIFDWGQQKARVNAQKTAQIIAQLNYNNETVNIESDIRQSLRNLENYRNQIGIAEKQVRNTEMTYRLNEIRYREGDLTGLQMSQYQSQLSSAKSSLVSSQIRYKNEMLNLKILTLYDFENDRQIIPIREISGFTIR
jgi:outer membrane protein TolC